MDSLSHLSMIALAAVVFLLVITLLVAVHELGHFVAAKLFGMEVDAFAVMMGGRRATDLSQGLAKPMVSPWLPGSLAIVSLVVLAISASMGLNAIYLLALASLGIGIPLWVASRIGALYHLPVSQWGKTLAYSWGAGIGVLYMATRFQHVNFSQVLAIFLFASCVALLLVYYHPILRKAEDSPMGEGNITANGEEVPVSFRPLFSRRSRAGTEFSMLLVPLGGFAAIKGMHPKPDGSETKIAGGFYSKPPWQRLAVLFAGPLFSVLLGVFLFIVLYASFGMYQISNKPIVSEDVMPGKPAALAGLKKGDRFLQVDGKPVATFYDVLKVVRDKAGVPVSLKVERGTRKLDFVLTPEPSNGPIPVLGPDMMPTPETRVQGQMGIPLGRERVRMTLAAATRQAIQAPVQMVAGLAGIVKKPSRASQEVGGPGTIAIFAFEATKEGIVAITGLAAGLSISLGIMNLLPIPPLDGGQMLVALVEMFRRGRRLSMQVQQMVSNIGFMLVLLMIVSVLAVDVGRIVGKGSDEPAQKPPVEKSR